MSETDALTLATNAVIDELRSTTIAVSGSVPSSDESLEDVAERFAWAALKASGGLAAGAQPLPVANEGPSCHDLAIEGIRTYARSALGSYEGNADLLCSDLFERKLFGLKKYDTLLQPHNGRDAMADAYAESLDLLVYLTQREHETDDVMVRSHLRDVHRLCLWLAGEVKR